MAISRSKKKNETLVTHIYPDSLISEQYRMIQANIKFSMFDKKSGIFLITSPSVGEGKSTMAANLAISIAQQKEKVLLIDANLRNPILHSLFKISNSCGLTDVLLGKATFDEAIHHTEIGRLDVLTSGPILYNPVELLNSKVMQGLVKTVCQRYDVVLIDSHSVIELTDTKLLANQCDGVIMVIKRGKTTREKAVEAQKELEFSKAKLVGVIFNE
ncbi:MAG: CpsD/CapB family tyrosine-protein kinase [Bacillota bacterium]|nr:CpsD/CapB family tyrosine-protein kinase [Bacillota bacterium]